MAGGLCNIHRFYIVVTCLFLYVVYCAVKQTISWLWPVVNKLTTIQESRNIDGIVDGRVFSDANVQQVMSTVKCSICHY